MYTFFKNRHYECLTTLKLTYFILGNSQALI